MFNMHHRLTSKTFYCLRNILSNIWPLKINHHTIAVFFKPIELKVVVYQTIQKMVA